MNSTAVRKSEAKPQRSSRLRWLALNSIGRVRRVTLNGRDYLVAPAVSINPDSGVLNGSKGSLLYPPSECAANVAQWDEVPLTMYHPTGNMGEHLSASSPGVWERQGIGHIRNSKFDGKLRHEFWFDRALTQSADRRFGTDVLNRLERCADGLRCEPMELSTGLYTTNEPAPPGATHNGKPYDYVARDYIADHVAVLPGQVGACSVKDGCGVLVNANPEGRNQYTKGLKQIGLEKKAQIKDHVAAASEHESLAKDADEVGRSDEADKHYYRAQWHKDQAEKLRKQIRNSDGDDKKGGCGDGG